MSNNPLLTTLLAALEREEAVARAVVVEPGDGDTLPVRRLRSRERLIAPRGAEGLGGAFYVRSWYVSGPVFSPLPTVLRSR
jgi:hypothetical protein